LVYFPDFRGEFGKLFLDNYFTEEDYAISYKNVLRGFHLTTKGYRLYTPIYGRFYIVALDTREDSPMKNKWHPFYIDHGNRMSFLIPPKVAFAYLALSELCICHYKWENQYDSSLEETIKFNDPKYKVYWPMDESNFIISERDFYCNEKLIRE
jgi:dTDP-4-dehydrorhamnose 3,5-epimerase